MSERATALLIVDLQNDYFAGGRMELVGTRAAAENARRALDAFRASGGPVVHVRHVATSAAATFFLPGTEGAEIHATVAPAPGELVVTKHYPNSFRETGLRAHLESVGVGAVVICGAMSHMCIDATTRAAADSGLDCTVLADACATRELRFQDRVVAAADVHAAFMSALGSAYATVMTTDAYLAARA